MSSAGSSVSSEGGGVGGDRLVCRSFTDARRRPTEIGRIPGLSLPWTFTLAQVGITAAALMFGLMLIAAGAPGWVMIPVLGAGLVAAKAARRVRIDQRSFAAGLAGRARFAAAKRKSRMLAPRSVDVLDGNAAVGSDHSVWLVFAVSPADYGLLADLGRSLASLAAVERLCSSVGAKQWRMMSTLEDVSAEVVAGRVAAASDAATWGSEVAAESARLRNVTLTERRFWLWVHAGRVDPPAGLAGLFERVARVAGAPLAARGSWLDSDALEAMSSSVVARAGGLVELRPASVEELCGLLERVPLGAAPCLPSSALPPDLPHLTPRRVDGARTVGSGVVEAASAWRKGGAVWSEPAPGTAVAVTPDGGVVAHRTVTVAGLPAEWNVPGGGELLWALDSLEDPWDWLVDVKATPHAVATARSRNQARQLASQFAQYEGDPSGPPPELDLAAAQVDTERAALAASGGGDEYTVNVLMSTAVRAQSEDVADAAQVLADRFHRLEARAAAVGVTVAAPAGDQVAARKVWTPRRVAAPILRDYRQVMLADGLAGLGPYLQSRLGDPYGALLGVHDERGYLEPVLFDPSLGPRAHLVGGQPKSPSIGIAGRPGSGKSVFAKRVLWTTLAAGGRCVVVDRSEIGEYVAFAEAVAASVPELTVEVIAVDDPGGLSIDPLRTVPDARVAADTAVRLLSYAAGLDPRSSTATGLGTAAADCHNKSMLDLVAAAAGGGAGGGEDWRQLRSLVELLAADAVGGALFDPARPPADLTADLVVLHSPGLSLSEEPDTAADLAATAVVLGMMLVGRALTFSSARFSGLMLDEAWSLVPDARARTVIDEAIRDGRKHNAAVWLATQSAADFDTAALRDLLGHVALFSMSTLEAAEAGARLAGADPAVAAPLLMQFPTGTMLWRDCFGRVGVVDVLLPADQRAVEAIDSTPEAASRQAA